MVWTSEKIQTIRILKTEVLTPHWRSWNSASAYDAFLTASLGHSSPSSPALHQHHPLSPPQLFAAPVRLLRSSICIGSRKDSVRDIGVLQARLGQIAILAWWTLAIACYLLCKVRAWGREKGCKLNLLQLQMTYIATIFAWEEGVSVEGREGRAFRPGRYTAVREHLENWIHKFSHNFKTKLRQNSGHSKY